MKRLKYMLASAMLTAQTAAMAGGILTNTNQSVEFLRNPARDAAIGIDGVYSNPAGVAFLPEGFHLGLNWMTAHQTRTVTTTNDLFKLGAKNGNSAEKTFKGLADAPFIPSVQAAWNKGPWSFQFNFSIPGGGGKCEFDEGIGSFETVVGSIASELATTSNTLNGMIAPLGASVPNVTGYDVDGYMKGRQYYFGVQLGAARKITKNLSVYAGLRVLYGTATYEARLNNIRVMDGTTGTTLPEYVIGVAKGLTTAEANLKSAIQTKVGTYMAGGMSQADAMQQTDVQALVKSGEQLQDVAKKVAAQGEQLAPYANGMNLKSDQTGWGVAPVLGVDYKVGAFNFAAKYEFKTRMRMKNNSDLEQAMIPATAKYVNGTSVPEDAPALLAVGAQWSVIDNVRVNLGYHHFFDTKAHWYNNSQELLDGGTDEYLAGAEWDITPRLTVSAGGQITRYDLTDAYMNDISFVVNSWNLGAGLDYQISNVVKLKAGYFHSFYGDYDMNTPAQKVKVGGDSGLTLRIPAGRSNFTRTNYVFSLGCNLTL